MRRCTQKKMDVATQKKTPSNRVRVFASAMRKREEETVSVKKKQHKKKQTNKISEFSNCGDGATE